MGHYYFYKHSRLFHIDCSANYFHQSPYVWSEPRCAPVWRPEVVFWYARGGTTAGTKWFELLLLLKFYSALLIDFHSSLLLLLIIIISIVFTPWTGFTTKQAEVMVQVLMRMTNSNMDTIYNDMVTKVQQVRYFTFITQFSVSVHVTACMSLLL